MTNINNISFKFVSDFKLLLIISGHQTATSMYPCPYCFVTLADLKNRQDFDDNKPNDVASSSNAQSLESNNECVRLKTYGDLKKDYEQFCSIGKNNKHIKQCHSTINHPLFNENDDIYIIQKCIIPEYFTRIC